MHPPVTVVGFSRLGGVYIDAQHAGQALERVGLALGVHPLQYRVGAHFLCQFIGAEHIVTVVHFLGLILGACCVFGLVLIVPGFGQHIAGHFDIRCPFIALGCVDKLQ